MQKLTNQNPDLDMVKSSIEMIKKEESTPERKKGNQINFFVEYFESLRFHQEWIVKFDKEVSSILGKDLEKKVI